MAYVEFTEIELDLEEHIRVRKEDFGLLFFNTENGNLTFLKVRGLSFSFDEREKGLKVSVRGEKGQILALLEGLKERCLIKGFRYV